MIVIGNFENTSTVMLDLYCHFCLYLNWKPATRTFNPLMGFAAPQISLVIRSLGGAYDSCPSRGAYRPCSGYLALPVSTCGTWGSYCSFGARPGFKGRTLSFLGEGRFIPNLEKMNLVDAIFFQMVD